MTLFGILPCIPTFQQFYHSLPTLAELPQGRVKHEHTAAARVQALTLLHCTPGPPSNEKYDQIYRMIGIPPRSLRQISHTARNRGFDPAVSLIIKDAYVEDAKRSGRPVTATTPEISEKVTALIRQTRATREYSSEYVAWKFGISASSVQRILKRDNMRKRKPFWKCALKKEVKDARLKFCLDHRDCANEGEWLGRWRYVTWTDETSVVLGQRRGGLKAAVEKEG
jgi:hypothetical protein